MAVAVAVVVSVAVTFTLTTLSPSASVTGWTVSEVSASVSVLSDASRYSIVASASVGVAITVTSATSFTTHTL